MIRHTIFLRLSFILLLLLPLRDGRAERRIVPVGGSAVSNSITALLQDDDGFVWVGSVSGLMRYDMYGFRYFDDCDQLPISRALIRCLAKGDDGRIWIGTEFGAAVYDPATGRFSRIGGPVRDMAVKTLAMAAGGTVLMTTGEGVAAVDPVTGAVDFIAGADRGEYLNNILTTTVAADGTVWGWNHGELLRFDFAADHTVSAIRNFRLDCAVRTLAVDDNGWLWFNDRRRLLRMPLPSGDPSTWRAQPQEVMNSVDVRSISICGSGAIVTSAYDGIHRFGIRDETVEHETCVWIDSDAPHEVCNCVLCVMRDRDDNYWYGTVDGIYVECPTPDDPFVCISAGGGNGLMHSVVSDLCLGPDGAVWAATSGGLDRLELSGGEVSRITHFVPHLTSEEDRRLQTIAFDRSGLMWVGSKRSLFCFNPTTGRFSATPAVSDVLADNEAFFSKAICCGADGRLWMGFIYGGLFVCHPETQRCLPVRFTDTELADAHVQAILEEDNCLWIGTKLKGLLRFRPDSATKSGGGFCIADYDCYFRRNTANGNRFVGINALWRTADGEIYAGTSHGLFRYDRSADDFVHCPLNTFGEEDAVLDIIGDDTGDLWLATVQGLYRYREGMPQAFFYKISGGLFARLDYGLGCCRDATGQLLIGGINGVVRFNPRDVAYPEYLGKAYVSEVSVLNERLSADDKRIDGNINRSHHLTLAHDDYLFSLDFTTLTFAPDNDITYYYRIDGLGHEWISLGKTNRLSFSNLARGEYLLRVRAADASGLLGDEETCIAITVLPPWWKTGWAIGLYAMAALLLTAAVVQMILARYSAEQKVRMERYKQRLFINMTHGFKTPLAMMQVPLQLLSDDSRTFTEEERSRLLTMVGANVRKLSGMIRQLMEFRKIDRHRVTLNLATIDIGDYVMQICDCFRGLYDAKGVQLQCTMPDETLTLTVDPEKIEIALYNLLHNAYTFTPAGGRVKIQLESDGTSAAIRVTDTGIGIRPEYLNKIFRRFYQVHEPDTMPPPGAGIGLAVAKEFVELHNGRIEVESRYGEGSIFTIVLPIEGRYLTEHRYIHKADEERIEPLYTRQYVAGDTYTGSATTTDESKSGTVYVMAGGEDIADLIRMVLTDYNVVWFNSVERVAKAVAERRPQLLLVDMVIYDREDVLTLCRRMKGSKQTDDIPLVVLTADTTPEDARLFCESGVDSWMEKPFDVALFRARVTQLVDRHAELEQKIKMKRILAMHGEEVEVESADEKFMRQVMDVIARHIPDEDFSLEVFAREMYVSRSVLNMRIQSIAGKSPMELLRNVRMQRAAQLLETEAYDIAQVSFMVGFSDPRYFSTSFRKHFGESPRSWMQNHRKK